MNHPLLPLVKLQLAVEHDLDDALLEHKLIAAEALIGSYLGVVNDAPQAIITEATLQLVAHLYAHREATTDMRLAPIPFGVVDILRPYAEAVTGYVHVSS